MYKLDKNNIDLIASLFEGWNEQFAGGTYTHFAKMPEQKPLSDLLAK